MGDRNYSNQYKPFIAQNYGYSQPQRQSLSSYFDIRPPQSGGFSVNTNMPTYNSGDAYNQAQNSGIGQAQSRESPAYDDDDRPPPSYEESRGDILLSRSGTQKRYSPAWDYLKNEEGKQHSQSRSFSSLFDLPGQVEPVHKPSEWSNDNFSSSQSYQQGPQGRLNFSQHPSTNFSSDYRRQSDYRFSQNSNTPGRQTDNFRQYSRGFNKNNQNRGRGKDGFRVRGNRQNRGGSRERGSWQGDDRGGSKHSSDQSKGGSNQVEFNIQEQGSDDEGNDEYGYGGREETVDPGKVNVFVPDLSLVKKYEYYPPSPEEMGEMFKDLVIHFFFKAPKNKKERNPFVVICESFRRSAGYANLEVEDGYDPQVKDRKFCTLRYQGMMLVRGVGENNNLKEPRVLAGVKLINQLAMSCYTLKAKPEYFNIQGFQNMQNKGDVPGVYCIVPKETAYDFNSASSYLQNAFSKEDSDVEYMFCIEKRQETIKLRSWASKNHFDTRIIKDTWLGVYKHRTLQYWRDKILASGSMENDKYILKPPQGIGKLLISNFDVKSVIVQLKTRPRTNECTLRNVYGPKGVGPTISRALPPWERRGGNKKTKNKNKKVRKIMEMVKQGVPLNKTKGYMFLSKGKKRNLKKKLAQT